jgi:hypothetical protein
MIGVRLESSRNLDALDFGPSKLSARNSARRLHVYSFEGGWRAHFGRSEM